MKSRFRLSLLKMTIFQKLLIGIIALLMLNTIIAFVGIISINEFEKTAYIMVEESQEQSAFQKLKLNVQQLLMPANDYLVHGNKVEKYNFEQLLTVVKAQIIECRELIGHEHEHVALNDFEKSLTVAEVLALEILKLESPIGNPEGAIMMEEMDAVTNEAIKSIDEMLMVASLEMTEYINTNQATNIQATRVIIFVGLFIALCLVVGGFFYVKEITKPIKHLAQTAQKISSGDLSAKADVKTRTRDEIDDYAKSFNNMIGVLEKTTVSRDYFNNILNRMVDTLIITEANGKIAIVNQATLDLLDYTEEEIIGQSIDKILSRESGEEILNSSNTYINVEEESVQNIFNTYYSKSGKAIPVSFSRSIMHDNENKISGMICIAFNNTESLHEEQPSNGENSVNEARYIKAVGEIPLTKRE